MAKQISDSEFKAEVLESEVPVLVDFWAPWCGPCRMLGPIVEELSTEVGDKAKVVKVNVDECPEIAGKYGITTIPTVIIFDKGEASDTLIGVQPKPKYLAALGL
jgi:thioredoxin 1